MVLQSPNIKNSRLQQLTVRSLGNSFIFKAIEEALKTSLTEFGSSILKATEEALKTSLIEFG